MKIQDRFHQLISQTEVRIGEPSTQGMDILISAIPVSELPLKLIVFDVIFIPEDSPLNHLRQAQRLHSRPRQNNSLGANAQDWGFFIGTESAWRIQTPPVIKLNAKIFIARLQ